MAAVATSLRRSPLTPSTITPPSLNRQHSYKTTRQAGQETSGNATAVLTYLRTRSVSPDRRSPTKGSAKSPVTTPLESPSMQRQTSWEDCVHQRNGYISFPDFDQLREQREQYANRQ